MEQVPCLAGCIFPAVPRWNSSQQREVGGLKAPQVIPQGPVGLGCAQTPTQTPTSSSSGTVQLLCCVSSPLPH